MNLKLLLKQAGVRRISVEKEKVVLTFDPKSSDRPSPARVRRGPGKGKERVYARISV